MYRLVLLCLIGLAAAGNTHNHVNDDDDDWPFGPSSGLSNDHGGIFATGGNKDYWGSSSGRRQQINSVEISAAAISRILIGAHSNMGQFCNVHSNRPLREVYGVEHFQLRVALAEFTDKDIQVKIWQRLVLVHAQNSSTEYASLRILPDVVDTQQAIWKFEGGTLVVYFPYAITPDTQVQSRCGRELNPRMIVVPKCAADRVFNKDYDVSFGDDKLRRALVQIQNQVANEGHLKDNSNDYIQNNSDEDDCEDEDK